MRFNSRFFTLFSAIALSTAGAGMACVADTEKASDVQCAVCAKKPDANTPLWRLYAKTSADIVHLFHGIKEEMESAFAEIKEITCDAAKEAHALAVHNRVVAQARAALSQFATRAAAYVDPQSSDDLLIIKIARPDNSIPWSTLAAYLESVDEREWHKFLTCLKQLPVDASIAEIHALVNDFLLKISLKKA